MATITTRAGKGSPLTNTEVDANFTNLNSDKQEILTEGAFVDGDKTKLDGIESGATADQTAGEIKTAYESNPDTNAFTDAEQSKLTGIEASADVTDTANVTAAGALMDSEVTNLAQVKAFDSADYATAAQGSTADSALQNVVEDTTPQLGGNLDTNGNDITFGDNDKAIFGAGSDLQIYHDNSNGYSVIADVGTGDLEILATDFAIRNADRTKTYLGATSGGAVSIRYDGATKLATTATGIDVTGTVTADGLTVDGDAVVSSANARLRLKETDTTDNDTQLQTTGGVFKISRLDDDNATATQRFTIDNATGDISFYEDTGTTPKLFWDASAESLGIGTSSPSAKLSVTGLAMNSASSGVELEGAWPWLKFKDTEINQDSWLQYVDGSNFIVKQIDYDDRNSVPSTVGTERLRIDSSGNVGIGRTNITQPSAGATTLAIQGTDNNKAGAIFLYSANDSVTSYIYPDSVNGLSINTSTSHPIVFRTAGSERMRIDSSGNVGIGTSSPAGILHISSGDPELFLTDTGTGVNNSLDANSSVGNFQIHVDKDDTASDPKFIVNVGGNNSAIEAHETETRFYTDSTERMRIDSSGRVGIGTSSPDAQLEIESADSSSNASLSIRGGASSAQSILYMGDGTNINVQHIVSDHGDNSLRFHTAASGLGVNERMRIDSSGNLLVGATSQIGSAKIVSVSGNNGLAAKTTAGANTYEAIVAARDGTVGKAITFWYSLPSPATQAGYINIDSSSSVSLNNISDYRSKENITPLTNSTERVKNLNPVSFSYIADGYEAEGFVAHEVAEVLPQAVNGEKDAINEDGTPNYQAMDQTKLIPLLTGALQEAIARIETLESEIQTLKGN